jgi:hypothetical protein
MPTLMRYSMTEKRVMILLVVVNWLERVHIEKMTRMIDRTNKVQMR